MNVTRKQLIAAVRGEGWNGEGGLEGLKAFVSDRNIELKAGDNPVDIDAAWTQTKTVTVTADAGEQVVINQTASYGGEDEDGEKAVDEDEDEGQKARRPSARDVHKAINNATKGSTMLDAKSYRNIQRRKDYTRAAQLGIPFGGDKCYFSDGDRAEYAGAVLRLATFGSVKSGEIAARYASLRKRDEEIVTKSGTIGFNASYGVLVVGEYLPELIENLNSFGAARGAVGITRMTNDSITMPRITDDVVVYDVAEAGTINQSNANVDLVSIYAKKTAALMPMSNELLNDATVDPVNLATGSVIRSIGKWEDESFLSGQHNRPGLLTTTALDADSTYDAANASWGDWTIAKLQAAKAKRAGWAHRRRIAWIVHPAFYEAVLKVNAYSAGGTPAETIINGVSRPSWDGDPVIFSEHMPSSFQADQIVGYVGAFPDSAKFGVVNGSEQMATSTDYGFATDQTFFRYTQRWGYALHDVVGANSGVIALKD